MIDLEILKDYGTTEDMFRAVFTACGDYEKANGYEKDVVDCKWDRMDDEEKKDITKEDFAKQVCEKLLKTRNKFEEEIRNHITEGIRWSLKNYRFYISADMAWDTSPVRKENIPLKLYAEGKIDLKKTVEQLKSICKDEDTVEKMIERDGETKEIKSIDLTRLYEMDLNLVRPYLRRRIAAQSQKYNNAYPYFKYDPHSKTMVSKLQAEVLNQRIQYVVDQFLYDHDFTQNLRYLFMYSGVLTFIQHPWVKKHQKRKKFVGESKNYEIEDYVEREGVIFHTPHPTRRFYDMRFPLHSINIDHGCNYVGYWDIVQFRDVRNNRRFFNRDSIGLSGDSLYSSNLDYFNYYFSEQLKFPNAPESSDTEDNLRENQTSYYSASNDDEHTWLSYYYRKIVPSRDGFGDYPYSVWVKFTVAGEDTVVDAQILPSRPACYMGYEEDDQKILNASMVHEIIPYQDQASNFMSQALYLMKIQSLLFVSADTDMISTSMRKHIKEFLKGGKYYSEAMYYEHSGSETEELYGKQIQSKPPIQVTQASMSNIINELLNNVVTITGLLEKNQMMSPQELGQYNQRETSAEEASIVNQSTSSLYGYISQGPDEYRTAMKIILYESLLSMGSDKIMVSVPERYPDEVIEKAGFSKIDQKYGLLDKRVTNIIGDKYNISASYKFTSRDGSEREINTSSAKVLSDLVRYVLQSQETLNWFVQKFGDEQFVMMLSEIFRLSGSGYVLKLPADAEETQITAQNLLSQVKQYVEEHTAEHQEINADLEEMQGGLVELINQLSPESPPQNQQQPQQPPGKPMMNPPMGQSPAYP